MFIFLLVVDLIAATTWKEEPATVDVRPDAALMDHVTRPVDVEDRADAFVLVHPVYVSDLQENLNDEIKTGHSHCRIFDRSN